MVHSVYVKEIQEYPTIKETIGKYNTDLKELEDFIKPYEGSKDYVEILMQYQINKIYKALEYHVKKIDENK